MSHPTPETEARKARIADWYRRKQEIGTTKTLAYELGVSELTVKAIIYRLRNEPKQGNDA
jgi:hypothetical protein